jgi:hypothetical protein
MVFADGVARRSPVGDLTRCIAATHAAARLVEFVAGRKK